MKRLLLSIVFALVITSLSYAQGPRASVGFMLPTERYTIANETVATNYTGFYIGGGYEIPFSEHFGAEADLFLYNYGNKSKDQDIRYSNTGVLVPLYLYAQLPIGSDTEGSIYAGPFAGFGIASKHNGIDDYKTGDWKRFHAGLSFGLSITFAETYEIYAGYFIGLSDLYKPSLTNVRASFFEIGFTYCFDI